MSGIPSSDIDTEYERTELDAYIDNAFSENTSLIFGLNARQQDGKNRGFPDFGFALPVDYDFSQDTYAAFVEARHKIDALTIEGSLRIDTPKDFDNETSFRLGAAYKISHESEVFTVFNQGYKLPSFFALAHPLVGNSELQPERSDNFEIGFKSTLSETVDYSLVYFANRFTDLVDFDAELFTNVNRNKVDTSGLEFDLQAPLSKSIRLSANVRYLDIDAQEGVTLRKRANISGNMQLYLDYKSTTTVFFVDFRDNFLDSSIATGNVNLPGYATLGISTSYSINDKAQLSVNINNALGKQYEDSVGFIQDSTQARVGIMYQFSLIAAATYT